MSSLITAYICEEDIVEEVIKLFKRTLKVEPKRMKILEFMREAAASTEPLKYPLLIIEGLSELLTSKYSEPEVATTLLRETIRKLSRDSNTIIKVKKLRWTPGKRDQIQINGTTLKVSEIDIQTTMTLRREHLGKRQKKKRDNFIIIKI